MLMKRIGKMKQKKGAVLFAVIAVMALLIAMASTAYYTARSAYNSVVSNYNYSQLYLSAISVSDMISEAVTNDSVSTATGAGLNNYQPLRDAILTMETVGETISAYSSNISSPTASQQTIINELASQESVVAGALDGVTVTISLDDNTNLVAGPEAVNDGLNSQWYYYEYKYTFTTTAYYRSNTITVEDVVVTMKAKKYTPDPGSPGGGGSPAIPPQPGNNSVSFSTFFTATGQVISDVNGVPDITRTSRVVKVKTHKISDDAFFQNDNTYFVNGNDNQFVGGITSTGSVYLEKFTTNIPAKEYDADGNVIPETANDWYIGEDLVLTNNNANNLNLQNNNLYIGKDLVIGCNGNITAEDIYVEGDLYVMGQANITGNLHVSGNIYYQMGDTIVDADGNEIPSAVTNAALGDISIGYTSYDNYGSNGWKVSGELDVNGTVVLPEGASDSATAKINVNGTDQYIKNGSSATATTDSQGNSTQGAVGTYNPDDILVDVSTRQPSQEEGEDYFVSSSSQQSVTNALESQSGTNIEYDSYTSPQTAYDKKVTVDFSLLQPYPPQVEDENGEIPAIEYYEYLDPTTGVYIKAEGSDTINNCNNVTVDIPYDENGYTLDIPASGFNVLNPNANIEYEIGTGDETVPIVLAPNITYDNGTPGDTSDDVPGFSWQGNGYSNNSSQTQIVAGTYGASNTVGNVVFETANIDATGKYVPYNPNAYSDTTSTVYVTGSKEVVGSAAQVGAIGKDGFLTGDEANSMYQTGTSTPTTQYENHFMLVSNANNATAVDSRRQNNVFCGYIYAPNGEMDNYYANGETAPVFGGMIVSTYSSELSKLYYAEPRPSTITAMLGSLVSLVPGVSNGGTPGVPEIPPTPPTPPGPGTWGSPIPVDSWGVEGSNYVG